MSSNFNKPIAESDPSDAFHTEQGNRQYHCPKCDTLTVIRGGQRFCRCYKGGLHSWESWKEVFLD